MSNSSRKEENLVDSREASLQAKRLDEIGVDVCGHEQVRS